MPDNVVSTTFAGLDGLYVSFVNSLGLINGFSNIIATGASGMRKIKAAQTVPSALPRPNRKVIRGDDRAYDQFVFASDQLPGGTIEVGTNDLTLDAAAQTSLVWALGHWSIGIYGISNPTFPNLLLLGHQQAHSQDAGSVGQAGFNNLLWPNVQLLPLGEDNPNFQAEGKNMYEATFLPFATIPIGPDLDNTNLGAEDGIKLKWWSKYRTFFYAVIGDGIATSFVVDHTPVDVASTKVYGTLLDGSAPAAAVTVATVTPSTKTISVSPTVLAANKIYICQFEASKLT